MGPELANKYNWWQVGSVPILLTEYQKSMVGQVLMHIQHRHTVCDKFHICHDLVLDQSVNDNYHPTSLPHEALDVNPKMIMLRIGWYHNTFSHLYVKHQHYPEHDTLCLSIIFYWLFSCLPPDQWLHVYDNHWIYFLEFFSQTEILFWCERMH